MKLFQDPSHYESRGSYASVKLDQGNKQIYGEVCHKKQEGRCYTFTMDFVLEKDIDLERMNAPFP